MPWDLDHTPWVDPLTGLTTVAAATQNLQLTTHIFVLPLRDPILVAKTVGTIAAMVPGRLELGVGVGWFRDEFVLTGTEFSTRGGRTEEASKSCARYGGHGRHRTRAGITHSRTSGCFPSRRSRLLGGTSDAALERATRVGDGCLAMPATINPCEHELLPTMRAGVEHRSRAGVDFHVNVVPSDVTRPEHLERLDALGITSGQLHHFDRATATGGSLDAKLTAIGLRAERRHIH